MQPCAVGSIRNRLDRLFHCTVCPSYVKVPLVRITSQAYSGEHGQRLGWSDLQPWGHKFGSKSEASKRAKGALGGVAFQRYCACCCWLSGQEIVNRNTDSSTDSTSCLIEAPTVMRLAIRRS